VKISVGLVMVQAGHVLLVHPGGPFFAKKDAGAWSIPKGLPDPGEDLFAAACREFQEETGFHPPSEPTAYHPLGSAKQTKKIVHAWAFELPEDAEWSPDDLVSNTFELEWPPKSGKRTSFPEVDRGAFFELETARVRAVQGQIPLLERALAAFP
jgi:predicted NUDIX family NTP pyrophosphohydrolase